MTQIIGRIYKIVSSECDGVYIGSTTLQMNKRFNLHNSDYKRHVAGKCHYVTSFEILKFADAKIELVHEGVFDGKKDLEQFEGELIRTTPNAVNKIVVGRSTKEYYQDNKEALQQKKRQYGEANRESIRIWSNTKCTCDVCGGKFTNANKAQHLRSKKHQNSSSSSGSSPSSSDVESDTGTNTSDPEFDQ
jgi:hypothetical protein